MDKKTGIIIGILLVAVLGLIGFAFFADSNDTDILTINDVGYEKDAFEKYYKVRYFEELQSAEEGTEVDKDELKTTALNEYTTYMILNREAKSQGYIFDSNLLTAIAEDYDAEDFDREALTNLGITREDYIEARRIGEMANDFLDRVNEFYQVPQSTIDSYFEQNADEMKGYDFRIMQFNITKNTEQNATAENNDEVAEEAATSSSNKDEIVAKAQSILDRVKAGEDFETLAKENADLRYALTNSELKQVNGELESVDGPYLKSYLMFSCSELEEPIKALENAGDYTELVTTDSYVAFARLEGVRDEIEEDTREAIVEELGKSYGTSYLSSIVQSSSVIINNRILKSIEI